MYHVADESMFLKALKSHPPRWMMRASMYFLFLFLDLVCFTSEARVFLNAGPENLFCALTVSQSCCCFSPCLFLCCYLPSDNYNNDALARQQPSDVTQQYQAAQSVGKTEHGQKYHGVRNEVQLGNARIDLFSLIRHPVVELGAGRNPCISERILHCVLKPFSLQRQLLASPTPCLAFLAPSR